MKNLPSLKTAMTPFPYSVDLHAPIDQAQQLMQQHHVRHLPVTEQRAVVGVISDRNMKSALESPAGSADSGKLTVKDLYNADPYIVSIDAPIEEVLLTMADRHVGATIVLKGGRLAGVFTAVDACRCFGEFLRSRYPRSGGGDAA